MSFLSRYRFLSAIALGAMVCACGCHNTPSTPNAQNESATSAQQEQGQDPADANLAPVSSGGTGQASSAPAGESSYDQSGGAAPQDANYDQQPQATAPQPPPPLPDYNQPPDPGDGYIWTPGYWAWAPTGYYWVPGVWVEPPYVGALWTPGYWASVGGGFGWFPGHWGRHIGYYGGINYGFGYTGLGYEGGYWNNGHFAYNREYNNVNTAVVHNVYSYKAPNRETSHVSYNGGRGGIQARPRPQEMAARREPSAPKMQTQVRYQQSYRSNREQFATVNHGRPANTAVSRPLPADRNVRPMAPSQPRSAPAARGPETRHAPSERQAEPRGQSRPEGRPEQNRR